MECYIFARLELHVVEQHSPQNLILRARTPMVPQPRILTIKDVRSVEEPR